MWSQVSRRAAQSGVSNQGCLPEMFTYNSTRVGELLEDVSNEDEIVVLKHKKPKKALAQRKIAETVTTSRAVPKDSLDESIDAVITSSTVITERGSGRTSCPLKQ